VVAGGCIPIPLMKRNYPAFFIQAEGVEVESTKPFQV
jgi:hypothetical protein